MQINKIVSDAIKPNAAASSNVLGGVEGQNQESPASFSAFLDKAVSGVNQDMVKASELQQINAVGGPVDVHEVMIAGAKADVSFRMLLQVRNKVVSAYEEVMRMQV